MMEERRHIVAPALLALDSDSTLERGNPIATERSPLLGVAGVMAYNAAGTTKGDNSTPSTIGSGTNGEAHRSSNGDDAAYEPRILVSHTRLLTILCTLWVCSFPHLPHLLLITA